MEKARKAVLKAMQQHPTESTVQRAASRALFNLVSGSVENKMFFAKEQALSLLLQSVQRHEHASWLGDSGLSFGGKLMGGTRIPKRLLTYKPGRIQS